MSTLQWALLLLGAGIVLAVYLSSRRPRRPDSARESPPAASGQPSDQLEMLGESPREFDEFGVGRARKRVAPEVHPGGAPVADPEPRIHKQPPAFLKATIPPKQSEVPEKIVGLYIAEHEGTNILGQRIHEALGRQGLKFGARKIYHRAHGTEIAFSVASLVKPGYLDPAEAARFSTPGLSIFMVLPGPSQPVAAFHDMLKTARELAQNLNAELYDTERRPLTDELARELEARVHNWVRNRSVPRATV